MKKEVEKLRSAQATEAIQARLSRTIAQNKNTINDKTNENES